MAFYTPKHNNDAVSNSKTVMSICYLYLFLQHWQPKHNDCTASDSDASAANELPASQLFHVRDSTTKTPTLLRR